MNRPESANEGGRSPSDRCQQRSRSLFLEHAWLAWESLPKASERGAFFIPHLVDHRFGSNWRAIVHDSPPDQANVSRWWHPQLLDPAIVTTIRQHFLFEGPIPHVALQEAFPVEQAWAIWKELSTASFVRHHFSDYQIDILPMDELAPSGILTRLVTWLRTKEAAAAHQWLVGWPHPRPTHSAIQVQISRLREGDFFAMHEDTEREGIAVVYNLSAHWSPEWGGNLFFLHPDKQRIALAIPPVFNSALIFRPQGAPHWVEPVRAIPDGIARYTITCFYLVGDATPSASL